jgi:hypothetical protein
MRRFALAALALLVMSSAYGGDGPGMQLDDLWFKVKVKAKGLAFGGPLEEPKKASFSATAYVHLNLDEVVDGAAPSYIVSVWSETAPGVWDDADIDTESYELETGTGVYLFSQMDLSVHTPDGSQISFDGVMKLDPTGKFAEDGDVLKASFSSLGMKVDAGELADGTHFRGGGTVKGKTVDVEDLPFQPLPP